MEVLVNCCYGGFGMSNEAIMLYCQLKNLSQDEFSEFSVSRHDPVLVQCFKMLNEKFDSTMSKTGIQYIPARFENYYTLHDNDGCETVVILHNEYDMDHYPEDTDTFDILLNSCYGGFSPSDKARELYCQKKLELDPSFQDTVWWYDDHRIRTDPILISCFSELGEEFNTYCCKARVETIRMKYFDYFHILDYDGIETISINMNAYLNDNPDA